MKDKPEIVVALVPVAKIVGYERGVGRERKRVYGTREKSVEEEVGGDGRS